MKIHNLKDLKTALNKVPDNVLSKYIVFQDVENDNSLAIGTFFPNNIDPKFDEEEEAMKILQKNSKKYPIINHIGNFFQMCGEEAVNEDSEGYPVEYTPKKKRK